MLKGTGDKRMLATEIQRDEKGRVIAADGWPTTGLATISEAIAVSGLSRSKIYDMIAKRQLESRQFGKSRRITWGSLRQVFMSGGE